MIDWNKTTKQVYDFVRGLSPYPAAWTTLVAPDGKELVMKLFTTEKLIGEGGTVGSVRTDGKKSFDIALNDGYLRIKELQIAGKKRMDVESFLRGFKLSNEFKVK